MCSKPRSPTFIDTLSVGDKYGGHKVSASAMPSNVSEGNSDDESSEDEEDDQGTLATGILDKEYTAALQAIRDKDPRVYDKGTVFYSSVDDVGFPQGAVMHREKPVLLRDYQREKLLSVAEIENTNDIEPSYANQQDQTRTAVIQQINSVMQDGHSEAEQTDMADGATGDDLFTLKEPIIIEHRGTAISTAEVEQAGRDPDGFLSRFLTTRAWVPSESARFQPFESDDEEYEKKADEFEEAYNLRFEDAVGANEAIVTHARDAAAKHSVRAEAKNKRKRARETENAQKKEANTERLKEQGMLRKLRLASAEEKLDKIRDAAGITGTVVDLGDWAEFLTDDWDEGKWDSMMQQKFDHEYYKGKDDAFHDEGARGKAPRPRGGSDIDITNNVPTFGVESKQTSSSDEDDKVTRGKKLEVAMVVDDDQSKKEVRKQRRMLQQLVSEKADLEDALEGVKSRDSSNFRYRETSPINFGLTAHDILMASDSQLNQFAGLKKLATFRDTQKRRKDLKRLGKKARLRQWRRETFGNEHGSQSTLQETIQQQDQGFQADKLEDNIEKNSKVLQSNAKIGSSSRRKRKGKRGAAS